MSDRIQILIEIALQEDIGAGDITSDALFGETVEKTGEIVVKQDGVVAAGMDVARRVFATVDRHLDWKGLVEDGAVVSKGQKVARISGRYKSLLRAERTALNFLQHLSGVATRTKAFVERVKGTKAKILDTRKTLPGLRALEKDAVKTGGGTNHRMGLYDRYLIKDNHLMGISITEAVKKAKEHRMEIYPTSTEGALRGRLHPALPVEGATRAPMIELEVQSLDQIDEAVASGADVLMMDNFSVEDLKTAVQKVRGRARIEASGGINLENVADYAKTGVDFISVGALTHSASFVDFSLDIS